jgi:hypothetical protein
VNLPLWLRWWLAGAAAGIALVLVMAFSPIVAWLALAALVGLVVRSPERAAVGGGAIIPTALWLLYELRIEVERCTHIVRGRSVPCASFGVEMQAIVMGLYLAVGIGLTAYAALRRPRLPQDAGDRSAAVPTRR